MNYFEKRQKAIALERDKISGLSNIKLLIKILLLIIPRDGNVKIEAIRQELKLRGE